MEEGLDKLYIDHVIAAAPCKLNGLKVVMDCSNGANSVIAPVILRSLGVEVVTIFNQPNGINISNNRAHERQKPRFERSRQGY